MTRLHVWPFHYWQLGIQSSRPHQFEKKLHIAFTFVEINRSHTFDFELLTDIQADVTVHTASSTEAIVRIFEHDVHHTNVACHDCPL